MSSVHPQHDITAVSDKWVPVSSNLEQGCGGVANIWKRLLPAYPSQLLTAIESVGLAYCYHPPTDVPSPLYMPSADQPQELYSSYLETVEHAISKFSDYGLVVVMCDLNVHFGSS